jgi:hypothetical protein
LLIHTDFQEFVAHATSKCGIFSKENIFLSLFILNHNDKLVRVFFIQSLKSFDSRISLSQTILGVGFHISIPT